MIQFTLRAIAIAAVGLTLTACAGMGPYSGYSNAPLASTAVVQHPEVNGGRIDPAAMAKLEYLDASCQQQIRSQLAGAAQGATVGLLTGATGGALGTGGGASLAFQDAVSMAEYSIYGAAAMGIPNALNGAAASGQALTVAEAECLKNFWSISQKADPNWEGTFVVPALNGKSWFGSRPPALVDGGSQPR